MRGRVKSQGGESRNDTLNKGRSYSLGFPFPIGGGGMYADPAGIFLAENPIFQK